MGNFSLQVVENGNPVDRKNWFPDIEPLFKLLSYENVPPFLKVHSLSPYALIILLEHYTVALNSSVVYS